MEIVQDRDGHSFPAELFDPELGSRVGPVVAHFCLDGATCVVVSLSSINNEIQGKSKHEQSCLRGEIAGTLLVNNEQYLAFIVDESQKQAKGGSKKQVLSEILTRRELQVASLVAEGKVNKQIAALLGISEWTVSTHLRRTFAKLGVRSRAAMAAYVASHFSIPTRE